MGQGVGRTRPIRALVVALVALLWAGPVLARQSTPPPLTAYGTLPSRELVQLSPSGARVAFVTVAGERRQLSVVDLATEAVLGTVGVGEAKVRSLGWIDDTRVLVTTSSTETMPLIGLDQSEVFIGQIFNVATGRITQMLRPTRSLFPGLMSSVRIRTGEALPDLYVRAHSFQSPNELNLYRVNADTGAARQAESMPRDVDDFILGDDGRVVARSAYDQRNRAWSLQLRRDLRFEEVWRVAAPLDPPSLIGLGMAGDTVIVSADRPDLRREGREDARFFDVNLTTGVWRAVRFDFNPDTLLFHPVSRRLIGASRLEDTGRRYAFADDAAGLLWDTIEQSLPGASPALISWSDDLRRAVVFTTGPDDAGTYRLVDLNASQIRLIGRAYRDIPTDQVAPIEPISFAAADGLALHGYLTTPVGRAARNLPLVVLAHGGPASRDVLTFDWWGQALASRGYAVLQVNFRGSTG